MCLIIIVCLVLSFLAAKPSLQDVFSKDGSHVSREHTTMIGGLFIWQVFICHLLSYKPAFSPIDSHLSWLFMYPQQLCVAPFFFFSGYRLMCSLRQKGMSYARDLICVRFAKLLLHFSLAVLLYVLLLSFFGVHFSTKHILLSLICWESVGNSNWFICITLISYIAIFLSYVLWRKVGMTAVALSVATLLLLLIPHIEHKGRCWIDTLLCIPVGMLFSIWRNKIERGIERLRLPIWAIGVPLLPLSIYIYRLPQLEGAWKNIGAVIFAFAIYLLFSAIRLEKKPIFLCWGGGAALFYLYVFQRIPMYLGFRWGLNQSMPVVYGIICAVITILLACVSIKTFTLLDKIIFKTTK